MRSKKSPGRSPWAVFTLSFAISLAVLLVTVMAVLTATVSPRRSTASESGNGEVIETFQYEPGEKESINILFISCRQRSDLPFAYTLVRFDPKGDRLILVPIPPETVVTVGAKTGTFTRHYDYAGSANARLAAESLFLCDVDRYVRVAKAGAVNLIDALGGLEKQFDTGYETDTVTVPAGNHLLTGELLYEIAASPPEGSQALSWRTELYRELIEQRLTAAAAERLDYLWEVFWNNTDTDLSQFDCNARWNAMKYFLESETHTVEVYPLAGTWDQQRETLTADESSVGELRLLLGAGDDEE